MIFPFAFKALMVCASGNQTDKQTGDSNKFEKPALTGALTLTISPSHSDFNLISH